jgi:hypothetical protein
VFAWLGEKPRRVEGCGLLLLCGCNWHDGCCVTVPKWMKDAWVLFVEFMGQSLRGLMNR